MAMLAAQVLTGLDVEMSRREESSKGASAGASRALKHRCDFCGSNRPPRLSAQALYIHFG